MSSSNEGPVGILDHVGIDVGDLDRSARFWMALLGLEVEERSDPYIFFRKQSDGPGLYLQKVPEKKTAKTRVHVDIAVENLNTAVARAVALGAKEVQSFVEGATGHVVMEDPDSNEFCLTHL